MSTIEALLADIDNRWSPPTHSARVHLRLIGQTSLYLQTGYARGTKDSDVLETRQVTGPVRAQLEALAGRGTALAHRHGLYVDVVDSAIPLLPSDPVWHAYPLELAHFDVSVLDVTDIVVSKLYRYISTDREDVRTMVEGGHVEHGRLRERLQNVIERYEFEARADRLPAMVERFHALERDAFLREPSELTLHPSVYR